MTSLDVELFGKFCAHYADQPIKGWEANKVQELICYLLLHRSRPHTRETLASILWENNTTAQSKKYLRQTLWQLQTGLESCTSAAEDRLLLLEPNWINLNPAYELWLDVDEFEAAYRLVRGIGGAQLDEQQVARVQAAVALYKGDLLEGWYRDWCWIERERLQNMYLTLLDKLMAYSEVHRRYEAGMDYGARILNYDRARERTHQQLIRLYMLAGDRAGALRQYERCEAALRDELSVKPSKYSQALYAQIRADTLDPTPFAPGATAPDLVKRLDNLRQMLADMQAYLHAEMTSIEQQLNRGEINNNLTEY